jgi:hypothetical protein
MLSERVECRRKEGMNALGRRKQGEAAHACAGEERKARRAVVNARKRERERRGTFLLLPELGDVCFCFWFSS